MSSQTLSTSTRRFVFDRVIRHRKWILLSVVFAAGTALFQVQTSRLVQRFVDEAIRPKDLHHLFFLCGLLLFLVVGEGITDFIHRICTRIGTERFVRDLRVEVFKRFLVFSEAQSSRFASGKVVSHVVSDVHAAGLAMTNGADLVREPFILVAMLGYLFYLNWQLTLVSMIMLPLVGILGKKLGRSALRNQSKIQGSLGDISNHIVESIRGLRSAHVFGRGEFLLKQFQDKAHEAYGYLLRLARTEELVSPLSKFFAAIVGVLVIFFAGYLVTKGRLTEGEFVAFILTAGRLQHPLRMLNQVSVRFNQVMAAAERVRPIVQETLDPLSQDQLSTLSTSQEPSKNQPFRSLEFQDLSFTYPHGSESKISLNKINITLSAGESLALVGPSGAGKTTLSLMALRLLDPQSGAVMLNQKDAREWELNKYRSYFSVVSQDTFLFNATVRENLLFARESASESELWDALAAVQLKKLVTELPHGLDTPLGESSARLSGGERQRMSMARSFLKNAPVLILDEATSQLDSENEALIQKSLKTLLTGRTSLIIAHRLSTIRDAQKVAVMKDGGIAEIGPAAELLDNPDSMFTRLWRAQMGYSA